MLLGTKNDNKNKEFYVIYLPKNRTSELHVHKHYECSSLDKLGNQQHQTTICVILPRKNGFPAAETEEEYL